MDMLNSFTTVSLLMMGTVILSTIIWILALVDIVRNEFGGENDKIIWVLIVALTGIIGAIIYFVIGKNQKI